MTNEFPKKLDPKSFEDRIYQNWEENWHFKPLETKTWNSFFIPMPPPNVTWVLHLWHALTNTLEDIMARYHRKKGDSTIFLPWTDHAWIATQVKVEKLLKEKENLSRVELWREKFLEKVWDFKKESHSTIVSQIRKTWASCDWSNERFTLDEGLSKRVSDGFVELYNRGLIYKWEYMVNYSPALDTVISDEEVVYKEEKSKLYYITYFVSGSDKEVVVATTRPETLLWDVAVAVNPKDKEYKKLLKAGKKLILPIVNSEIPLVWDEMVDMEFWTWAVKITPAHDKNDFEVAKRHNLPLNKIVVDKTWKMTAAAWIFEGQDYKTARKNIVELLKAKGNLHKIEDYTHKVAYCDRSWSKVETIVTPQWFVKSSEIIKKVMKWYKKKEFEIIPSRFEKTFEDWFEKMWDWCISRQLWWGHQIPVYYHNETWEILVTSDDMSKNTDYTRDNDVLDTWFSSAMWPFSTLDFDINSQDQSEMFKRFYPAWMLETGHDIILFWCIRMLMFGYEFTWQTPFKKIYLHGLVRDKNWTKMSKSLWNGIDPLDMIEKHWADALRMTLSIWNTPWNDLKFDEDNVINNKAFINKIWNATRFAHSNIVSENDSINTDISAIEANLIENYEDLMPHEKWILSKLRNVADLNTKAQENYTFSEAWLELQNFTKNLFCDYYIEEFKLTKEDSKYGKDVITYVLYHILNLWHPFIPFVTQELYERLGFEWNLINIPWSEVKISEDKTIEKEKELVLDIIKNIRNIRAESGVLPSKTVSLIFVTKGKNKTILEKFESIISWIVKSSETLIQDKKPENDDDYSYWVIKAWVEIYVDTSNAINFDEEIKRINDQILDTKDYIWIISKKLLNESFVKNAPAHLVRAESEKKEKAEQKLAKLEEKLNKISR